MRIGLQTLGSSECLGSPGQGLVAEPCFPGILVGDYCVLPVMIGHGGVLAGGWGTGTPGCAGAGVLRGFLDPAGGFGSGGVPGHRAMGAATPSTVAVWSAACLLRSEIRTISTSASDSVISPVMTTPPPSTGRAGRPRRCGECRPRGTAGTMSLTGSPDRSPRRRTGATVRSSPVSHPDVRCRCPLGGDAVRPHPVTLGHRRLVACPPPRLAYPPPSGDAPTGRTRVRQCAPSVFDSRARGRCSCRSAMDRSPTS